MWNSWDLESAPSAFILPMKHANKNLQKPSHASWNVHWATVSWVFWSVPSPTWCEHSLICVIIAPYSQWVFTLRDGWCGPFWLGSIIYCLVDFRWNLDVITGLHKIKLCRSSGCPIKGKKTLVSYLTLNTTHTIYCYMPQHLSFDISLDGEYNMLCVGMTTIRGLMREMGGCGWMSE